jgi:hypothetical protein
MEERTPGRSSDAAKPQSDETPHEDRSVWVLTAYAISGLALLGVLIYYFSTYVTR